MTRYDESKERENENAVQNPPPANLGLTRQSSYQKMLANYNQKKEKLQRTQTPGGGKPTILPAGPSGIMTYQRRPSAGGGQERQPQYLAYLEKTLEKSDLTIQTVK